MKMLNKASCLFLFRGTMGFLLDECVQEDLPCCSEK